MTHEKCYAVEFHIGDADNSQPLDENDVMNIYISVYPIIERYLTIIDPCRRILQLMIEGGESSKDYICGELDGLTTDFGKLTLSSTTLILKSRIEEVRQQIAQNLQKRKRGGKKRPRH